MQLKVVQVRLLSKVNDVALLEPGADYCLTFAVRIPSPLSIIGTGGSRCLHCCHVLESPGLM